MSIPWDAGATGRSPGTASAADPAAPRAGRVAHAPSLPGGTDSDTYACGPRCLNGPLRNLLHLANVHPGQRVLPVDSRRRLTFPTVTIERATYGTTRATERSDFVFLIHADATRPSAKRACGLVQLDSMTGKRTVRSKRPRLAAQFCLVTDTGEVGLDQLAERCLASDDNATRPVDPLALLQRQFQELAAVVEAQSMTIQTLLARVPHAGADTTSVANPPGLGDSAHRAADMNAFGGMALNLPPLRPYESYDDDGSFLAD